MIFDVNEGTTPRYTATLLDELGAVVPAASLSAIVLSVFNKHTGTVLNGRNRQNVLNANNVSISAGGVLVWSIQAADLDVPGAQDVATILAVFEYEWSSGTKKDWHEVELRVSALPRPTP